MASSSPVAAAAAATTGKAFAFHPANRVEKYAATTVWQTFTPLAIATKAVNLGQGFPGWAPPKFGADFLAEAVQSPVVMDNQYARSLAHPALAQQLAAKYGRELGREISWETEVVACNGATETLFCAMGGLLDKGDEVVLFEPSFDLYTPHAEIHGGVTVPVPLRVQEEKSETGGAAEKRWVFDRDEFAAAFNAKTRVLLLNTPHNPTGKVMTRDELAFISEVLQKWPDVVVMCDEVYEHLVFDQHEHIHLAALPGMWDRTLTVSSAGKTFSTTGWKVGWAVGPKHLISAVQAMHQWTVFSVNTPAQNAIAKMLEFAEKPYEGEASYYAWLRTEYARKRTLLCDALTAAGMVPVQPEGAFFVMADTSHLKLPAKYDEEYKDEPYDWRVARWLCVEIGVCAIPPSSFYVPENKVLAKHLLRFAFCKPDSDLLAAGEKLLKISQQ
jgi:kynurenine--oxoglutarate transaminase/cysteine-S-conjugate beta-lyase/glutamine--phenylpyruvate transaminase